jgi:hypothetical protein
LGSRRHRSSGQNSLEISPNSPDSGAAANTQQPNSVSRYFEPCPRYFSNDRRLSICSGHYTATMQFRLHTATRISVWQTAALFRPASPRRLAEPKFPPSRISGPVSATWYLQVPIPLPDGIVTNESREPARSVAQFSPVRRAASFRGSHGTNSEDRVAPSAATIRGTNKLGRRC